MGDRFASTEFPQRNKKEKEASEENNGRLKLPLCVRLFVEDNGKDPIPLRTKDKEYVANHPGLNKCCHLHC